MYRGYTGGNDDGDTTLPCGHGSHTQSPCLYPCWVTRLHKIGWNSFLAAIAAASFRFVGHTGCFRNLLSLGLGFHNAAT